MGSLPVGGPLLHDASHHSSARRLPHDLALRVPRILVVGEGHEMDEGGRCRVVGERQAEESHERVDEDAAHEEGPSGSLLASSNRLLVGSR